jgi:hypothetical protein
MFDSILIIAGALNAGLLSIGFLLTAREFSRTQPARARRNPSRR